MPLTITRHTLPCQLPQEFPALMLSNDKQTIILATEHYEHDEKGWCLKGMALQSTDPYAPVGDYNKYWDPKEFAPFYGTLTFTSSMGA